jgi:hypothetical protein
MEYLIICCICSQTRSISEMVPAKPLRDRRERYLVSHLADSLNLHLLEAVLPDDNVRGDTILPVVEEDDPIS